MSNDVLHFPTGLPYRVIGETKIYGRNKKSVDWLEKTFSSFERELPAEEKFDSDIANLSIETHIRKLTDTEINWLKRIEAILRNGLPTSDKATAETIGHAHSEIEWPLESINEDWWMK